jgi:hypothetical protein
MTPSTEPPPTRGDDRVDQLRQQLRALGYLDAGVDRFVLGPARSERRPAAIAALSASRIGLIAAALLGPAAALGVAVRLPGLITGPRDAFVVALYFAGLFGVAAAVASFAVSMLVAVVPVGRLSARARLVSRAAGTFVGGASLVYLTIWWRIASTDEGAATWGWTLFALAIAAAISLLLGHVTAITTFALLMARHGGEIVAGPRRSATALTVTAGVLAFAGACVLLLLTTPDATPPSERPALAVVSPGLRLKVLGIDGFDPAVLDDLRREGQTPTLARFRERGAYELTADPLRDPARAWTTMATGQPPDVHGVYGLETRRVAGLQGALASAPGGLWQTMRDATDLVRLTRPAVASGTERRSKTFWEVAADAGLRAAVVNWWATWPAEGGGANPPIVVSDRATLRLERGGEPEGEIAPRAVYDRLQQDWTAIKAGARAAIERHLPGVADPDAQAVLIRAAEIDAVQLEISRRLQVDTLDLLAVYLPGLDIVQHTLLQLRGAAGASALSARLDSVRAYYVYLDRLLAEVALPGGQEVVMLVTDPGRTQSRIPGLLMLEGSPAAAAIEGRGEPLVLAPTILYALGVPASRALGASPALALFGSDFVSRYPVREVDSYGERQAPRLRAGPMDQEMIERLRSLGYVR